MPLDTVYGTIFNAEPIDRKWLADCALLGRSRLATQTEFETILAMFVRAYRKRGLPMAMLSIGLRLAHAWREITAPAGAVAC